MGLQMYFHIIIIRADIKTEPISPFPLVCTSKAPASWATNSCAPSWSTVTPTHLGPLKPISSQDTCHARGPFKADAQTYGKSGHIVACNMFFLLTFDLLSSSAVFYFILFFEPIKLLTRINQFDWQLLTLKHCPLCLSVKITQNRPGKMESFSLGSFPTWILWDSL